MNKGLLVRLLMCLLVFGLFLFGYMGKQVELTELRLEIPALAKQAREIQEENIRLQYEIDRFENPAHLMAVAREPEFGHLRHPRLNDILTISGQHIASVEEEVAWGEAEKSTLSFGTVFGANNP